MRAETRYRLQALAVAATGPCVGLLLWGRWYPWAAALHVAAAAAAYRLWRHDGPEGKMLGVQAFSLLLCFPVVGSPAAWWIYGRGGERQDRLLDEYRRYIAYEHDGPRHVRPLVDARAALARELAVQPLGDQLDGGDIATKQSAAAALERQGDAGVQVLRRALSHPADDTRLLASLALVRMEERLVSRLKAARAAAKARPDDARAALALAAVARAYAESGLPAPRVAAAFWDECAAAARRARDLGTEPALLSQAQVHVAAAAKALGDWRGALGACAAALAFDPGCVEAAVLRLEARFALGQFEGMPAEARALLALAEPGSEAHEVATFWSEHRAG